MHQPVDLTNMKELIGNDQALQQALCAEFVKAADEALMLLAQQATLENPEKWRKTAHMFKGIAYNIGAYALGDLCKVAQEGADITSHDKKHMSEVIGVEYQEVKQYLDAMT